jgi:hypothetical protein
MNELLELLAKIPYRPIESEVSNIDIIRELYSKRNENENEEIGS